MSAMSLRPSQSSNGSDMMRASDFQEDGAMPFFNKRLGRAGGAIALALPLLSPAANAAEDVWPILKQQAFGDRAILAEDGMVVLEAPQTAEDAALVPITAVSYTHLRAHETDS